MNGQIKEYFRIHWVAMLLSAIPTTLVAIVSIVNIVTAYRIDYAELKLTVQANTDQLKSVVQIHQQLLQNEVQIKQQVSDDHQLLTDIHRYFFKN